MTHAFVTIDPERCNQDGICAAECPVKILGFPKKGETPSLVQGGEALCIRCGHCVAVCPTAAIRLNFLAPEDCTPVDRNLLPDEKATEHLLATRRSIRNYKKESVDKDRIEKLLATASLAPTGHNSRCVQWLVIHDTQEVRRLTAMVADWMRYMIKEQPAMAKAFHLEETVAGFDLGLDVICRDAPHIVVACAHKAAPTGAIDCATALAYLELAAPPMGLGTCWAGFFNIAATFWPPLKEALGLPKGVNNHGAVLLGVPRFKYHRIPPRQAASIRWV
jgi:nitroreductase/NAD-dependent dihydropyrimidine dehydrogenase PreA subunit